MFVLYRHPNDPVADAVAEQLRELVVAHRIVYVTDGVRLPDGVTPTAWPVLEAGTQRYEGREAIQLFLEELSHEVMLDRQFQSDACYLDPDDPTHCL